MYKNQKGFSLIELLIVVVIIGIIAAIAIPNLLAARVAANESTAAKKVMAIATAINEKKHAIEDANYTTPGYTVVVAKTATGWRINAIPDDASTSMFKRTGGDVFYTDSNVCTKTDSCALYKQTGNTAITDVNSVNVRRAN